VAVKLKKDIHQSVDFKDIKLIRRIDKGKCLIFLAASKDEKVKYALKVFPYPTDSKNQCGYFTNEVQFKILSHKNIIKILGYNDKYSLILNEKLAKASYIIMEYAPHGDLFKAIEQYDVFNDDEVLVRTYFHQLIEGMDYLHSKEVYHLDIKVENLLLGDDFILKIADFDNSALQKQGKIRSRGTRFYRAPELIHGRPKNLAKADIYSAAIVLFIMKCGGYYPQTEDELYNGVDFADLLKKRRHEDFWKAHCQIQCKPTKTYPKYFRKLINEMMDPDPDQRPSVSDIKTNPWYNERIYDDEELKEIMSTKYSMSPCLPIS